jgi:hypothetical protein
MLFALVFDDPGLYSFVQVAHERIDKWFLFPLKQKLPIIETISDKPHSVFTSFTNQVIFARRGPIFYW